MSGTVTILKDDGSVHEGTMIDNKPTPVPAAGISLRDRIAAVAHAANHAAARVYSLIAGIEDDVREWHDENPALAAIVDQSETMAEASLESLGIPVGAITVAWADIEAALKAMAAADASVVGHTAFTAASPAPVPTTAPEAST
jgi:hypothetical protein